jgi:hypothetical protein
MSKARCVQFSKLSITNKVQMPPGVTEKHVFHADFGLKMTKIASQSEHNPSADCGYLSPTHVSHPPTRTLKIVSIVQGVLRKIDRNQFEDGGRGSHIDKSNTGRGICPRPSEANSSFALRTWTSAMLKIRSNEKVRWFGTSSILTRYR